MAQPPWVPFPPPGPRPTWPLAPRPPAKSGSGCLVAVLIAFVSTFAAGGLVGAFFFLHREPGGTSSARARPSERADKGRLAPSEEDDPLEATDPDVPVAIHTDHYTITGTTESEMRRELDAEGPSDAKGHHDATTEWYVKWSYPRDKTGDSARRVPFMSR